MKSNFICERITQLRNKKGVSAMNMSISLEKGENYINQIENGQSLPSMNMFLSICDYFGISPQEFFDENNKSPQLINNIVLKLKKLNDEQLGIILGFINNLKTAN